jgi:hypothetical protein
MVTLGRAREPMSVRQAYGVHGRGIPKKTLQRALRHQEAPTGDCLVRRRVRFPGVSGSYVLLWTRARWRTWKATTWKATEPRSPVRLRALVLKAVAVKGGVAWEPPWRATYTCAGCGQEKRRPRSSPRTTCSAACRKRASRARRVTPLLDTAVTPLTGHRMSHPYWTVRRGCDRAEPSPRHHGERPRGAAVSPR